MSRVAILFVAMICLSAVRTGSVHAQSQLEIWCLDQGLDWNDDWGSGICSNDSKTAYVDQEEELAILATESLINHGSIYSYGIISNSGFLRQSAGLFNHNIIVNYGAIEIDGSIINYDQSEINNYGRIGIGAHVNGIKNWGVVNNHGEIQSSFLASAINNFGVLNNGLKGVIKNDGDIYGSDESTFTNDGTVYNTGFIGLEGTTTNNGVIVNGLVVYLKNTVDNNGDILNRGALRNDAVIHNLGYLSNQGTLINGYFEPANESGIYNEGVIYNSGTLDNFITLQNEGSMLRNMCLNSVINETTPISGSGLLLELDQCIGLPLVHRH